jgi:hypothetical protein
LGPIDAMSRDRLLAPARTVTQFRDIELTHRVVGRRAFDATVEPGFVGDVTAGFVIDVAVGFVGATRAATFVGGIGAGATSGAAATLVTSGATTFAESVGATARGTLSRATLSALATVVAAIVWCDGAVSTTAGRDVAVSAIATFAASAVSSDSGGGVVTFAATFARFIAGSSEPSS